MWVYSISQLCMFFVLFILPACMFYFSPLFLLLSVKYLYECIDQLHINSMYVLFDYQLLRVGIKYANYFLFINYYYIKLNRTKCI